MAKAAYIKKLFRSVQNEDWETYNQVAQLIIDEERKKSHFQLANDLQSIIDSSKIYKKADSNFQQHYMHLLPKDKDSNFQLIDIKKTNVQLDTLVLSQNISESLKDLLEEYEKGELLGAYGFRVRNRYLFCGPPGCGKTVTAEAIAQELDLPLLYTRFDSIVSSYLGETASNLRKIFDFVSKGNWLLFFDEFDAIAKKRDNSDEHGELKRVVNTFLQLLDNYDGNSIIIAATNHQQLLDPAIWRRFDEILLFEKPDLGQIQALLAKVLKRFPKEDIDIKHLSKSLVGFTHADIERICETTIKKVIIDNKKAIGMQDIEIQIDLYKKRDKIYNDLI